MPEPVAGTALLVEELLGSTLSSVVKAQGLVATQLADFIEQVGFEPTDDEATPMRARTFSFEYNRAEVGEDDEVVSRRVTVTMPLLSIVSLPALTIETADIDMDLRLIATDPAPDPPRPLLQTQRRPIRLWAIPGKTLPAPPPGRPADPGGGASGALKVRVTLRRMDMPLGLERVERLLADGYVEEVDEPEPVG